MPRMIDYSQVLAHLTADGLECHYFNGGAFGFPSGAIIRGWIESPDPTIKPQMRDNLRIVTSADQSKLATQAWLDLLPGVAWIMPGSHWSFELNDGSRTWLPQLLHEIGIDPQVLIGLTSAAALEFTPTEQPLFEMTLRTLLQNLTASDFSLAFPARKTVCTIHHHHQLWWTTRDPEVISGLDRLTAASPPPPVVPGPPHSHHS
jgi:hypothetical protein